MGRIVYNGSIFDYIFEQMVYNRLGYSAHYRQTFNVSTTANMFTQDTYVWLRIYFKITNLLSSTPFAYKASARSFQESSLLSMVWYIVLLIWCLLRTVWHAGWVASNLFYSLPPIADAALEAAFLIFNVSVLCMNIVSFVKRKSMVSFLKNMLALNSNLKSHYMLEHPRVLQCNDGCAIFLKLLTPAAMSTAIVVGLLFAIQPDSRIYFYKFVPVEKTAWTFVVYMVWECYTECWQVGIFFSVWFSELLFAKSAAFWVQQIW